MTSRHRLITLNFLWHWIKDHFAATMVMLVLCSVITVFSLNTDASETIVDATALYSINTPDKYSATDFQLIAKLKDGRTINMYLPQAWISPTPGTLIRVKRIRRLFFGERFVLLRDEISSTKTETP